MIRYNAQALRQPGSPAVEVAQDAPTFAQAPAVQSVPNKMERVSVDVERLTGVPLGEIYSERRYRYAARARQIAMYVIARTTPFPVTMIGRHFRRDHTTVGHAIKFIDYLRTRDQKLNAVVSELIAQHAGEIR